ncbi:C-4 sterol methyl oxidase [Mucor velutinosus]|uniref:C-4 sterol methyl oxidase n=1 Tax=Mucor velutinosus TaxID=708070 RepID=A0AAN7D532_9FUNG|nr:C-4 sterol methyl oxidase [Mucor velutinosus]
MSQRNNKYHVTIEDCPDEDDYRHFNQKSSGADDIDISHITSNQQENDSIMAIESSSRGSKRQAWDEVDALEEQARNEKMQNQPTAMANAKQTARIVEEATQQSSEF